jgi:hypothetical protein
VKSGSGAGRAVVEKDYKPWLHSPQNAGVGKKKTKQLTRQQKVRQQRGMEKADMTEAKLEKKVEDSKSRARRVQARRADWEDLNGDLGVIVPDAVVDTQKSNVKTKTISDRPEVELDSNMHELPVAADAEAEQVLSPGQEATTKVAELSISGTAAAIASNAADEVDEIS